MSSEVFTVYISVPDHEESAKLVETIQQVVFDLGGRIITHPNREQVAGYGSSLNLYRLLGQSDIYSRHF